MRAEREVIPLVDMETVIAFLLGLGAGLVASAPLVPTLAKRARAEHRREIERYEGELAAFRQERAEDRETNRRLRRELAVKTPANFEAIIEERSRALEELDQSQAELQQAMLELADRDRSLREARLAIQEIRLQLEEGRIVFDNADGAAGGKGLAAIDGEPQLGNGLGYLGTGRPLGEATAS